MPEQHAADRPMRLNAAARLLGYDRRTLLKHAARLGIFRLGNEYRVPAEAVAAVRSGALNHNDDGPRVSHHPEAANSPEVTRT